MKKKLLTTIPVILVLLLGGCIGTKGGLKKQAEGTGVSQTFEHGYNDVAKATRRAIVNSGLAIDEASQVAPGKLAIIAKKDSGRFSYGELVRVIVQELSEQRTQVEIITKKRVKLNVLAKGDWSQTIFSNIELELQ